MNAFSRPSVLLVLAASIIQQHSSSPFALAAPLPLPLQELHLHITLQFPSATISSPVIDDGGNGLVVGWTGVEAAAAASDDVAAEGEGLQMFGGVCEDVKIMGGTIVEAVCQDGEEKWETSLDLKQCVGSQDGEMLWKQKGGFDQQCHKCSLEDNQGENVLLKCACVDDHDALKEASLDLEAGEDGGLKAVDGRLACGDVQGTQSPSF